MSIIDNIDEAYVYVGDTTYKVFKNNNWSEFGVDFNDQIQAKIDDAYKTNNSWLNRLDDVRGFYKDCAAFIVADFGALPKANQLASTFYYAGSDDADPVTFVDNVKEQAEVIAEDIEKLTEKAGNAAESFSKNPKTYLAVGALVIGAGFAAAKKFKII